MKIGLDDLTPEVNAKSSATLSQFFLEKLGTPSDRGYM
jgi:hypothetical protein